MTVLCLSLSPSNCNFVQELFHLGTIYRFYKSEVVNIYSAGQMWPTGVLVLWLFSNFYARNRRLDSTGAAILRSILVASEQLLPLWTGHVTIHHNPSRHCNFLPNIKASVAWTGVFLTLEKYFLHCFPKWGNKVSMWLFLPLPSVMFLFPLSDPYSNFSSSKLWRKGFCFTDILLSVIYLAFSRILDFTASCFQTVGTK